MTMKLADRMEAIPFSGIRKVFEEVLRRERMGEKIIHLSVGRPDFDTPGHIKAAARKALDESKVHYSSNYGIRELREALVSKFNRENGLVYDPEDEIIVTVGANEAVLISMIGLLNPGDEVLVPDPCWTTYFHCIRIAGGVPVPGLELYEQGGGLVNIAGSWKVLEKLARSESAHKVLDWKIEAPCPLQSDGTAPAAYWRTPGGVSRVGEKW